MYVMKTKNASYSQRRFNCYQAVQNLVPAQAGKVTVGLAQWLK